MNSSDFDDRNSPTAQSYYRPCVGVALFNDQGCVWVGKRISEPDNNLQYAWQMPQGGIDTGEDPKNAVFRELQEETGTDKARLIRESEHWFHYDLPGNLLRNSDRSKFRGQTQKWFALRFTGADSEFRLDTHAKPEFSTWRWVSLQEVPELIVPFKRDVYKKVVEEFKDLPERIVNE